MTADPYFHMIVSGHFAITGRGVVLSGTVDKGSLRSGDEILIRGAGSGDLKVKAASIEANRKIVEQANVGDTIGILVKGLTRDEVQFAAEVLGPDLTAQ